MADEKSKDGIKIKGTPRIFNPQAIGRSIPKAPFSRLKPTTLLKGMGFQPVLRPSATPLPTVPGVNPFKDLPFPSPGERIKADDFKKLSQGLRIIYDSCALSSSLFGQNFGMVKLALTSQQYYIQRVMTVFGTEIDNLEDDSLDNRKVVQIMPAELGERSIIAVLAEAVKTRRFTPNVLGMNYAKASEKLRSVLGDVTFPSSKFEMPRVTDFKLEEAKEEIFE